MTQTTLSNHPLVYTDGILGFAGYIGANLFCTSAKDTGHAQHYGLDENAILIVDRKQPFAADKLNLFRVKTATEHAPRFTLSRKRERNCAFMGRVVMTVSQHD